MTLNEIRKQYNASSKTKKDIEIAAVNVLKVLKEVDTKTFMNIYCWSYDTLENNEMLINEMNREYCKTLKNEMIVSIKVLNQVVKTICDIDYETSNRAIWRCIYKNKLNKFDKVCNKTSWKNTYITGEKTETYLY